MTSSSNTDNLPEGQWYFGVNWVADGWEMSIDAFAGNYTGSNNFIVPSSIPDPGFINATLANLIPTNNSALVGVGGALSPNITSNILGGDFTPTKQYINGIQNRSSWGVGSDIGALSSGSTGGGRVTTGTQSGISSSTGTQSTGGVSTSTTESESSDSIILSISVTTLFILVF